jgi:hypothetical protein
MFLAATAAFCVECPLEHSYCRDGFLLARDLAVE